MYGKELIIDLANADVSKFNRDCLQEFLDRLCYEILKVRPEERHFWDDEGVPLEDQQTDPRTKGTTVVQFLLFSNVTIHTLDLMGTVYINIFVCREFDMKAAVEYSREFFKATLQKSEVIDRL